MKHLKGKNCLLTGAASGIGRALAFGLAEEGMRLYLVDLDMTGLEQVKAELESQGATVWIGKCDVSSYDDLKHLSQDVYSRLGDVDLLINNAGIAGAGLVEELEPEDWQHVFDVNTWSIIYAIRIFLPRMIEKGSGHIVNTGSGAGIVGIPYHIQYVVSKFAVVGISEALYSEIKHLYPGIDVSVICPTFLKTNIIDRTPIVLSDKLVTGTTRAELESRTDEFARLFWKRYTAKAPAVEDVVAGYIRDIKKGKLYIFDMPQLRIALILKGISDRLYRRVLRSEGKSHLKMIRDTLSEMGLEDNNP